MSAEHADPVWAYVVDHPDREERVLRYLTAYRVSIMTTIQRSAIIHIFSQRFDADDIYQEVSTELLFNSSFLEDPKKINVYRAHGYVRSIIRNITVDQLRHHGAQSRDPETEIRFTSRDERDEFWAHTPEMAPGQPYPRYVREWQRYGHLAKYKNAMRVVLNAAEFWQMAEEFTFAERNMTDDQARQIYWHALQFYFEEFIDSNGRISIEEVANCYGIKRRTFNRFINKWMEKMRYRLREEEWFDGNDGASESI